MAGSGTTDNWSRGVEPDVVERGLIRGAFLRQCRQLNLQSFADDGTGTRRRVSEREIRERAIGNGAVIHGSRWQTRLRSPAS